MRLRRAWCVVLCLAACGNAIEVRSQPAERCATTDCFNQLQARNYQLIDDTTLVVYVGNQDCPFVVEFTGGFCDLTFLPLARLTFRRDSFRAQREQDMLLTRICSHDSNIGIDEGTFTRAPGGDGFSDGRLSCRIQNIRSVTDDELLELYVERQIAAPPPPLGTGEISVPERPSEADDASEDAEEAGEPAAP